MPRPLQYRSPVRVTVVPVVVITVPQVATSADAASAGMRSAAVSKAALAMVTNAVRAFTKISLVRSSLRRANRLRGLTEERIRSGSLRVSERRQQCACGIRLEAGADQQVDDQRTQ